MREPEGGRLNRTFIGRHAEREEIKTRLGGGERLLLLHGQPMVGKARLAEQVTEELRAENEAEGKEPIVVHTIDCKDAADWPGVMRDLCMALSLGEAHTNENLLLSRVLDRFRDAGGTACIAGSPTCISEAVINKDTRRREGTGRVLLLLLKLHNLDPRSHHMESLSRFLNNLANNDVTTILTSRKRLPLSSSFLVKPMTQNDCLQLLSHQARDAHVEDLADIMNKHCYGLPPLVLEMAQYVGGDPLLAYTADELKEELDRDPSLLLRPLGEEAERLFSVLSRDVQSHVTTLAQLLDGTFSMEALSAALGVEGARAKTAIRRMCEESPLILDVTSQRMCIEPLVLHHVRKLGHMTADDQARLRVVTLIGRVLTHAERELYIEGQNTVYGHLHGDWPQLQHLLRQAIHCTDNTYQAYLKVAVESDKLLIKCFPEETLEFYKNMASAAIRYGTPRDQAVLQGLIGMAVTQGQGTEWQEALQYYHRALPVLREDPRSINLPRLLCDMGFTYFRLHQLHEADKYLQEALLVSHMTEVEDERHIFLLIRARSLLALPAIFRGHLTAGKKLLEETLAICSQQAPHHPDLPILINSLGLYYERSGKSHDTAMQYYLSSLAERRRYASVAPADLVPCLNNIGMQYGRMENYDEAFKYLEEAAAIRKRCGRWHYLTALTQQHLGQVCMQRGEYKRAEEHLLEAAQVYARCTPGHDIRGKVALCLSHVYITQPFCDLTNTKKYLVQVCELSEASGEDLSDVGLEMTLSAVQHRMQLDSWQPHRVRPLLRWTQKLFDQFEGDPSTQLADHKSILEAIANLSSTSSTEQEKTDVILRIIANCRICQCFGKNVNVLDLWRQMEKQTENVRKAKSVLLESDSLSELIQLSQQENERVQLPEQKRKDSIQVTKAPEAVVQPVLYQTPSGVGFETGGTIAQGLVHGRPCEISGSVIGQTADVLGGPSPELPPDHAERRSQDRVEGVTETGPQDYDAGLQEIIDRQLTRAQMHFETRQILDQGKAFLEQMRQLHPFGYDALNQGGGPADDIKQVPPPHGQILNQGRTPADETTHLGPFDTHAFNQERHPMDHTKHSALFGDQGRAAVVEITPYEEGCAPWCLDQSEKMGLFGVYSEARISHGSCPTVFETRPVSNYSSTSSEPSSTDSDEKNKRWDHRDVMGRGEQSGVIDKKDKYDASNVIKHKGQNDAAEQNDVGRRGQSNVTGGRSVTSPPSNVTSPETIPAEHLSEVTYHGGRFIFPLQETARDQQYLHARSVSPRHDADTSGVTSSQITSSNLGSSQKDAEILRGFVEGLPAGGNTTTDFQNILMNQHQIGPLQNARLNTEERGGLPEQREGFADSSEKPMFDIEPIRAIFSTEHATPKPVQTNITTEVSFFSKLFGGVQSQSEVVQANPSNPIPPSTQLSGGRYGVGWVQHEPTYPGTVPDRSVAQVSVKSGGSDSGTSGRRSSEPRGATSSIEHYQRAGNTQSDSRGTRFQTRGPLQSNLEVTEVQRYRPEQSNTGVSDIQSRVTQFQVCGPEQLQSRISNVHSDTQFQMLGHEQSSTGITDLHSKLLQCGNQSSKEVYLHPEPSSHPSRESTTQLTSDSQTQSRSELNRASSQASTSKSSATRPEPTLQDVATCAQHLLSALPRGGMQSVGYVFTDDQRRALEKLASLRNMETPLAALSVEEQRRALYKLGEEAAGSSTEGRSHGGQVSLVSGETFSASKDVEKVSSETKHPETDTQDSRVYAEETSPGNEEKAELVSVAVKPSAFQAGTSFQQGAPSSMLVSETTGCVVVASSTNTPGPSVPSAQRIEARRVSSGYFSSQGAFSSSPDSSTQGKDTVFSAHSARQTDQCSDQERPPSVSVSKTCNETFSALSASPKDTVDPLFYSSNARTPSESARNTISSSRYGNKGGSSTFAKDSSSEKSRLVFPNSQSRVPCEADSLDLHPEGVACSPSFRTDNPLRIAANSFTVVSASAVAVHAGIAAHATHARVPREATENDERFEQPEHVCTSVDCFCSLQKF